jgi:glycosyltransferase involved in cell wall biosynthesis
MKRILIFSNSDSGFYFHLLPIAIAAKKEGYEVILLIACTNYLEKIERHGFRIIPISLKRNGINPFLEILTLVKVIRTILSEKPDILHNFTIKPILYGSIASLFSRKKMKVINNFLGMGFIFISDKFLYLTLCKIICLILRLVSKIRNVKYIAQNPDDKQLLIDCKVTKALDISAQCSVGVEIKNFEQLAEPHGKIIFALVARMLMDKGVYEFAAAAKILRQKKLDAEFWLVGAPDEQNSASLNLLELQNIDKEGYVRYLGFQDIKKVWRGAHVAVLPSYREGLSRALLEAGAYGRAVITTDAPGGRELVTDHVNGLLVQPKDITGLASAMELLAVNQDLRKNLGVQIRKHISDNYDANIIAKKMIRFYKK